MTRFRKFWDLMSPIGAVLGVGLMVYAVVVSQEPVTFGVGLWLWLGWQLDDIDRELEIAKLERRIDYIQRGVSVPPGTRVVKDQYLGPVGSVGSTGSSTGPHVRMEPKPKGEAGDA